MSTTPDVPVAPPRNRWVLGATIIAVVVLTAIGGYVIRAPLYSRASREGQLVRFLIDPPLRRDPNPTEVAVSPDGRKVAFVASAPGGPRMLYVQPIDSASAQPLPGTEDALFPFWSPDSRFIGFGQGDELKKVEVAGGPPQRLCNLTTPWTTGAWNSDGVILFGMRNVLHRVSAAGGEPAPVTKLDKSRQETAHYWPSFLPDGRHYIYLAWSARPENRAIFAGSLDSEDRELIMPAEFKVNYASPGHLIFIREATLLAQPFDAGRLKLSGEPVRLAEDVISAPVSHRGAFSVSPGPGENTLVYASDPGTSGAKLTLTWVDRAGTVLGTFGSPGGYNGPDLSPDGKRLMIHRHEGTGGDLWNADLSGGETLRVTFDPAQDNGSPLWSPDGNYVAFGSKRNGKWGIYKKLANGTGAEERLVKSDDLIMSPMSWSADGHFILYWQNIDMAAKGDVWALPLTGERKPFPLLQTEFWESNPQMSPDGKWFAYMSNESVGKAQVYVQSFPPGKGKWRISQDGGYLPRWRADGNELFFTDACCFGTVMSAEIRVSGSTLVPDTPHRLFASGYNAVAMAVRNHSGASNGYVVSKDGQRFLIPRSDAPNANPPITVVLNWTTLLNKETGFTAR
jgi:Tol biopolymer transport system component